MDFGIRVAIPSDSTGDVSIMVDNVTVPVILPDGSSVTDFKANGVYSVTYYNGSFICSSNGGKKVDTVNFTSDMLLENYTANDSDGKAVVGTMTNNGSPTTTLNCDGSFTIQKGFYGGGIITANSLASQTQATATAPYILKGQTAWVNGQQVTGTLDNMSGTTPQWCGYETCVCQPNPVDPSQAMIKFPNYYGAGYYDTTSWAVGNLGNLNAGNIRAGVRVGRSENWGADDTNTITGTFTSDATATANNIISGKTAYVNGQKITGNIPTMNGSVGDSGSNAFTVSKDICKLALYNNDVGAYDLVFPRGYYDGVKTNRLHIPNLLPQNIVSGVQIGWEGNSITGTGGGKQFYYLKSTYAKTSSITLPFSAEIIIIRQYRSTGDVHVWKRGFYPSNYETRFYRVGGTTATYHTYQYDTTNVISINSNLAGETYEYEVFAYSV